MKIRTFSITATLATLTLVSLVLSPIAQGLSGDAEVSRDRNLQSQRLEPINADTTQYRNLQSNMLGPNNADTTRLGNLQYLQLTELDLTIPVPITLPEIGKLPFRLSLEPVDGQWEVNDTGTKEIRMILWDCAGRTAEILASLHIEEPYDQIVKVWVFIAADKNGDGRLSAEELTWALEQLRPDLVHELIKYVIKYQYRISTQVAYELGYTLFDELANIGALAQEYLPLIVGGIAAVGLLKLTGGVVTLGNSFGVFGIQLPVPEWMITRYMTFGYGTTDVYAMCPVDLSVADGLGRVVNKTQSDIPCASYVELDLNGDGEKEDMIILPSASSEYLIRVVPEPGAQPNDIYNLMVGNSWAGLTIAENTTIQDIPAEGYKLTSYDEYSLQVIPPIVSIVSPQNRTYYSDAVPLTLEISKPASWIGYSLDGQANVTIAGDTTITVQDGSHRIVVCANDTFGNMGHSDTTYFNVDTTFHDVAVLDVAGLKTVAGQGYTMRSNVTVGNHGNFTETFNVTAYANTTIIGTLINITLASGNSTTVTFTWNTSSFACGNYTLSAYAWPVRDETYTSDNSLTGSTVHVGVPGNVNYFDGSRMVDMIDMWLVQKYYGAVKGQPGPSYVPNYDIDDNGKIDMIDLWITQKHFGQIEP